MPEPDARQAGFWEDEPVIRRMDIDHDGFPAYSVLSRRGGRVRYVVFVADGRWVCSCPGHTNYATCRHARMVARMVAAGELPGNDP